MLYDYHTHTNLSLDSECSMTELCAYAATLDYLGGLCFTEHLDLDYPNMADFVIDFDDYIDQYKKACAAFPSLDLSLGVEVGYQRQAYLRQEEIIAAQPVDFIINSVHIVNGLDIYVPSYYAENKRCERYLQYLEAVLESVKAPITYSVLGHLGYVARISTYEKKDISYNEAPGLIDDILKALIESGHGLELNTRVFERYPLPSLEIVKRYRELGGQIITLGSDCHKRAGLARLFKEAAAALKDIGFKYACRYKRLEPVFEPL